MSNFDSQYSNNYVEYLVPMKNTPSLILKKLGIIFLSLALAVIGAIFILSSPFVPVMILYLVLVGILTWYLWRFVNIEFEYSITMGEIEMDIIYGQRKRKKLTSAKIREMSIIAPYDAKYESTLSSPDISKTIFAASDIKSPDTYFCIYNDEKNGKTLLFFSATKKTLDIMKFYNSSATVISDRVTH